MNVNSVVLTGNLTKDPELRTTGSGTSVTTLRLAVNERVKRDGDWQERAMYFDVVVWANQADNAAKYLEKGSPVAVKGRLSWREWSDKNDNKRQSVEVTAEMVQFLGRGDGSGGGGGGGQAQSDVPADTRDLPPSGGTPPPTGGADDDIPF
jgi:single-strand DNA-binding protein